MKFKKIISSVLVGTMLAGTALIGVTAAETNALPFDDVPDKWFKDAVTTVYEEGIMQGKSDTKFDPTANITRAEVVTAFARIACVNIDGKGDALTFTDTKTGKWYSDSVGWRLTTVSSKAEAMDASLPATTSQELSLRLSLSIL